MGRPRADGTRHFAGLEHVAPEVLDYIHAAFRLKRMGAGPTWESLLKALKDGFGFKWNDTSLSRYYKYWRSDLFILNAADDQAREMIECYKQHPTADLESLIRQQLASVRLLAVRDLEGADPTAVIALGQRQEQIDLAREKMDISKRELDIKVALADLERRKVELRERSQEVALRVEEKVKASGKTLDPEVLGIIREAVYGLPA